MPAGSCRSSSVGAAKRRKSSSVVTPRRATMARSLSLAMGIRGKCSGGGGSCQRSWSTRREFTPAPTLPSAPRSRQTSDAPRLFRLIQSTPDSAAAASRPSAKPRPAIAHRSRAAALACAPAARATHRIDSRAAAPRAPLRPDTSRSPPPDSGIRETSRAADGACSRACVRRAPPARAVPRATAQRARADRDTEDGSTRAALALLEHAHAPELLVPLLRQQTRLAFLQLLQPLFEVRREQLRRLRGVGVRAAGGLGDDVVDDAELLQVGGGDAHRRRGLGGGRRVLPQDRPATLGGE